MNDDNNYKPSFFKRLFIFGSTPRVLLNFLGMALATLLFLWLAFNSLKCYTQHNKTFEVPNFIDMNIADVKTEKKNSRFEFDLTESNYNKRLPKGVVVFQDPAPETRAKNGRTIYLSYNPMEVPLKKVPADLYGLRYEYLSLNDFEHRIIKKIIDPDAPGTIQEVSYKGKVIANRKIKYKLTKIPIGDTIDLIVSEGYNGGSTQVPDLVCLTYAEALFKLRNGHNLMLGSVALDATVTDSTTAFVVGQYPFYAPGEFISIGSQIDLRLTQSRPSDCGIGDFFPGNNDDSSDDLGF